MSHGASDFIILRICTVYQLMRHIVSYRILLKCLPTIASSHTRPLSALFQWFLEDLRRGIGFERHNKRQYPLPRAMEVRNAPIKYLYQS